jgi:hypothetical protein
MVVPRQAAFDPVVVGQRECAAWVAYYRHEWAALLQAALGMVAAGFGMDRRRTVQGAWHVLQANRAWAPVADNDPTAAREHMFRFYELVRGSGWGTFDTARAADLEIAWWAAHRAHQRAGATADPLVQALDALYACVYGVPAGTMRRAAELRAEAMDESDEWVAAGCRLDDPRLARERRALIGSFTALRDSVERYGAARSSS